MIQTSSQNAPVSPGGNRQQDKVCLPSVPAYGPPKRNSRHHFCSQAVLGSRTSEEIVEGVCGYIKSIGFGDSDRYAVSESMDRGRSMLTWKEKTKERQVIRASSGTSFMNNLQKSPRVGAIQSQLKTVLAVTHPWDLFGVANSQSQSALGCLIGERRSQPAERN